jgi:hypothetical protein
MAGTILHARDFPWVMTITTGTATTIMTTIIGMTVIVMTGQISIRALLRDSWINGTI